jgi:hypothetical protein
VAANTENDIVYLLELKLQHKNFLGQIRHWDNLKMAIDEESIWIKDFTGTQLDATELKTIPFAQLYYSRDNLLFPKDSLLPSRKLPAVLWTPIERALPVELGSFNHNFFGIHQQQILQLVSTDKEQTATILAADIATAGKYIVHAPAVRLQSLQWLLVNDTEALIMGEPLLPLNGKTYWQKGPYIFPAGFAFEFDILEKTAAEKIDAGGTNLIWWMNDKQYCLLPSASFQPLSIASWKQTIAAKSQHKKTDL